MTNYATTHGMTNASPPRGGAPKESQRHIEAHIENVHESANVAEQVIGRLRNLHSRLTGGPIGENAVGSVSPAPCGHTEEMRHAAGRVHVAVAELHALLDEIEKHV
jgi:hypothetical protein